MPGGRGFVDARTWFKDAFGFEELGYKETQAKFTFADGVLTSTVNGATAYVGDFETLSLGELKHRLSEVGAEGTADLGGLTFENISNSAKTLHLDRGNAGAVFQVASQFNCLEMNEPGARPESGVTRYCCDATQGPACALACPAGTVFRNYFVNGRGQGGGHQIDCLGDVAVLMGNATERYWKMVNGYALPDADGGIAKASARVTGEVGLAAKIHESLRVGIHWDTEVKTGTHRVCQVFCSALPVAYAKAVKSQSWEPLACAILDSSYEASLAVGALLARQRKERVTIFLTTVGGGAFGNRSQWILKAMERALVAHADSPIDVKLVHFGVAREAYAGLATKERKQPRLAGRKAGGAAPEAKPPAEEGAAPASSSTAAPEGAEQEEEGAAPASSSTAAPEGPEQASPSGSTGRAREAERLTEAFAMFDVNKDGVIEKKELVQVLQTLDPSFTEADALAAFRAADADGDGEVHYAEFAAWVCKTDTAITNRIVRMATGTAP